jgi:hypothetical protein
MKVKGVDLSALNKRQQTAMKRHGEHHTAKHLRDMLKRMKKGKSFTEAHKASMKAVGK